MIIDGKAVAKRIYDEVAHEVSLLSRAPVLAAIACAPNFETRKYLELKKQKAADVGIIVRVIELPETISTEEAIACVQAVAPDVDGIVVQLPFPSHINREELLAAVLVSKDPDGFSYGRHADACLPPVTGAIVAISKSYNISLLDKQIVILGAGRLVGAPTATYLEQAGAKVTVLTEVDQNREAILKEADCIISGIGKPHTITKDMVKEGVIIFDAGTSEDGGVVAGDVHPTVAQKSALFTPVPGGIGPITVAVLLRNLVTLVERQQK
jgi:methylenetetrahydrofolate dehydrogenase (NADP+) / methenyltetrahydrofolate cyclohydrolase